MRDDPSSLAAVKPQQSLACTGQASAAGKLRQQPESGSFLVYVVARMISDLHSTEQSKSSKKFSKNSLLVLHKRV